ncbi:piggyBac transposable element-derived protein 4-like [Xenopus laevis]|uniref:PiggyBac transposable element-derived protein 4-like n=1 Tax=Xenopus laevis TaxID=8355 RepID=A0A8J1KRS0_XENLA|nr:piggyBac transposable element-derived protein 4-like [Xenopus laevis]XP_041429860.1 piggyBac transposable element-derived protein 4-like [Xenopus laevis]
MAKRFFSAEEAAALCMASSSEEFSDSDSDSEYVPSDSDSSTDESPGGSSSTVTALEEAMELEQDLDDQVDQGVEDEGEGDRADAAAGGEPAWGPPGNFHPEIPPFTAVSGVKVDTRNFEPIDYFQLFLTEAILQDMVLYTNLYAEQHLAQNPLPRYARAHAWHPTDVNEIKRFVGLTLAMGLVKAHSLESYWDTTTVLSIPVFSATMPRNRYQLLLRFLHFNNNATAVPPNEPGHDRLHKLRPLIDSLSQRFGEVYTPSKNICIDESLLLFKGRIKFRQYIPSKRARYGIKFYKLCESSSGYTSFFMIYEGKDSQLDPPGCPLDLTVSGKIVWELITPLLGRGYHLYVDNFYTSILLFRTLYCLDTLACGTVNRNRKGLPRDLITKKLSRGEIYALRNDELLAIQYRDTRNVFMLTTIHDASVIAEQRVGRPPKNKPLCCKEYSKNMGGVDRTDQVQHYYNATRKTRAWYKKVGIYLIQVALRNSYVVYKAAVPGPKLSYYKYQLQIIPALLFGGVEEVVPEMPASDNVARLLGKHFIDTLPPTPGKQFAQKACKVCRKRGIRRDTRYYCPKCPRNPGLCFKPCFEIYHTQLHY